MRIQSSTTLGTALFLCISACADTPHTGDTQNADSGTHQDTGTTPRLELENGRHTFTHQEIERSYILYQPADLAENAPLVVVMHGYTGTARGIQGYSGMNDVADENGFAVVYPQGTRDAWDSSFFNVGYDFHQSSDVDDLSFLRDLIDYLQQGLHLSPENLFATGMSNGGDMSYLLACEASDAFKAIAPVAGTMMQDIYTSCAPEHPMPVFEIHGTEDDVTYWAGDLANVDGWGAYMDMPSVIDFWTQINNLDETETTSLPDTDASDGSQVVFVRHFSDTDSNEVWLYKVENGGHDWPGSWGNMDINSSSEIWGFFSRFLSDSADSN